MTLEEAMQKIVELQEILKNQELQLNEFSLLKEQLEKEKTALTQRVEKLQESNKFYFDRLQQQDLSMYQQKQQVEEPTEDDVKLPSISDILKNL